MTASLTVGTNLLGVNSGPEFRYSDLLPTGADDTPYRLVTTEGVSTFEADGRTLPPGLARRRSGALTAEAMHDIAHYLRPAHLAQLRRIIDDPESSGNDRFVALDLLKNVNISAGGVLPMCQDTGTAIVMGKKSEGVLTGADDGEAISRGVYDAYTKLNLRYSQLAPLTTYEEKNTGTNLPAQIELYSTPVKDGQPEYKFLFMAKGGGSANKSFLFQETKAVLNPAADADLPRREDPLARHRRLPAVPPGGRHRRHVGGVRAEDGEVRLGPLPRPPADRGDDGRARLPRPRARGAGLQADPVVRHRRAVRRQVLLPRRPGRAPPPPRRVLPGRDRGVVLGRPAGARQDHGRRGVPRAARDGPGDVPARHRGPAPRRGGRRGEDRPHPADGARSSPSSPGTR